MSESGPAAGLGEHAIPQLGGVALATPRKFDDAFGDYLPALLWLPASLSALRTSSNAMEIAIR
jgi:hypothetical protein